MSDRTRAQRVAGYRAQIWQALADAGHDEHRPDEVIEALLDVTARVNRMAPVQVAESEESRDG